MSREKELNFFLEEYNWRKGATWYESHFDGRAAVRGESSPLYTFHPVYAGVPERVRAVIPEAKLIYIVGDPVSRAVSQYLTGRMERFDRRPPDQALSGAPERNRYLAPGMYGEQISRYLRLFPRERILVLLKDDLLHKRQPTLQRVFRFLGVDEAFRSPALGELKNVSMGKRELDALGIFLRRAAALSPVRWLPRCLRDRFRFVYAPFSRPLERPALSAALHRRLREIYRNDLDRFQRLTGVTVPLESEPLEQV
jgi:hypothetical protein